VRPGNGTALSGRATHPRQRLKPITAGAFDARDEGRARAQLALCACACTRAGAPALKAAGLFDKFDKPAVNTPAVNSTSTDRPTKSPAASPVRSTIASPRSPRSDTPSPSTATGSPQQMSWPSEAKTAAKLPMRVPVPTNRRHDADEPLKLWGNLRRSARIPAVYEAAGRSVRREIATAAASTSVDRAVASAPCVPA
jgi:hypothetical protein